jgi:tetratricopeptide (TPR) repeat protein
MQVMRRLLALTVSLALGACAGATPDVARTAATQEEAEREMSATTSAFDRRDMPAVVRHGERVAALATSGRLRSSALVLVAVARWALSDRAGARAAAERAIAADPTAWRPYQARGLMRYDDKDYAAAMVDFHQATVFGSTERDPLIWHAYAAVALGRYGPAKESADRLVALYPRDAPSWFARGVVHQRMGDRAAAAADYRRALAIDPRHKYARAALAGLTGGAPRAPVSAPPPRHLLDL